MSVSIVGEGEPPFIKIKGIIVGLKKRTEKPVQSIPWCTAL
jgi:hypothetical protein